MLLQALVGDGEDDELDGVVGIGVVLEYLENCREGGGDVMILDHVQEGGEIVDMPCHAHFSIVTGGRGESRARDWRRDVLAAKEVGA